MTKPGKIFKVKYVDGVKIMFNQVTRELVYVLPSAMYGKDFHSWELLNLDKVNDFVIYNR